MGYRLNIPLLSVLLSLLLAACSDGERMRMEAILDEADSLNRAYIPLSDHDSLLTAAVCFYDRHGSHNDRLRAHYLLGCVYRDLGESPHALECYQAAVDAADTTEADCDYHRLMSVYGQMAILFHAQNLPSDEITMRQKAWRSAILAKDTFASIRCYETMMMPYYLLGDTDQVVNIIGMFYKLKC